MKKQKKIIAFFLAFVLLITGNFSSVAVVDENNFASGTGNPVGSATAGKASYTSLSQMWKISVYVAKKDTVTNSSEYTLTEDYHKFGYTFWLYRDGFGVQQITEAGVSLDNLYMELNNKEEYYHQNASYSQVKYNSIKDRVFKGSDYNLIGSSNSVPLIPNFGGNETAVKNFFDSNKTVSNAFVKLASKAAGSTPEDILSKLEFTINGETKTDWPLNMVDVRTPSVNKDHTSCVSWVFLYEPVIVINGTNITGYRHAVTPTGIAAAMKQGIYNWTSSQSDYIKRFKSSSELPNTIPSVPWGLGTDFPLLNMPNSLFLAEDWLGYKTGEYWQNLSSGQTWYVNEQLAGGGFGMRYQRAEIPKVIIQKTVNDSSIGDLSGFTFTVTSNSTGEQWTSTTNTEGKVTLYLPAGAYTLTESNVPGYEAVASKSFVVPTTATKDTVINVSFNNVMKVGTLEISKVAEDNEYSQTSFTFSSSDYEDFTISLTDTTSGTLTVNAKEGLSHLNLTYSITNGTLSDGSTCKRITLYGLPLGDWTITENRPARYGETYVGYVGSGQMESLSFTATVTENTTSSIRFDNFLQTYSLSIVKRIKAEDIVWAHGNPTFFFCTNTTILKYVPGAMGTAGSVKQIIEDTYYTMEFTKEYVETYLAANPGAEYVEMTLDISDFAVNSFNWVSELEVMRYKLAENGIEMREGTGTIYPHAAYVTVGNGNPHPVVSFTNDKVDQQGCSSNSIVINEFKVGG